jgi:hypothetical protein
LGEPAPRRGDRSLHLSNQPLGQRELLPGTCKTGVSLVYAVLRLIARNLRSASDLRHVFKIVPYKQFLMPDWRMRASDGDFGLIGNRVQ